MSPAPADPVDVERLANEQAVLDAAFPIASLSRLRESLASDDGAARASFRFYRVAGRPALDGEVDAEVTLTCQRCLTAMRLPIEGRLELVFVASEAEAAGELPEGLEPALAPNGRASLAAVVEDELLLSLPLVARHADPAECAQAAGPERVAAESAAAARREESVQRPFADLKDRLKS
jgi:uncharacterized protein